MPILGTGVVVYGKDHVRALRLRQPSATGQSPVRLSREVGFTSPPEYAEHIRNHRTLRSQVSFALTRIGDGATHTEASTAS